MADERLQAIKERLEALPSLPWAQEIVACGDDEVGHTHDEPGTGVHTNADDDDCRDYDPEIQTTGRADAEFIANAPSDIAYLLSLLELVQRAEAVQHKVNW